MSPAVFEKMVAHLRLAGFADDDIEWSENSGVPTSAEDFALEAIFVICNSGMKNTIARRIYEKVRMAIERGQSARTVFGHAGKAGAIDNIWRNRDKITDGYMAAPDKIAYCETLPWIGPITKYHLAKNFGVQVAKPDVHLQRLANLYQTTPQSLCEVLSVSSGLKVGTVDLLLWRAAATGILDTRTGNIGAAS